MKRTATIALISLVPFLCAQAQALQLHQVKKVYIQEAFAPIDATSAGRDFLPSLLQWLQVVAVREEADAILDVRHKAEEKLSISGLFTHVSKAEATLIDVKTKGGIWETKKEAKEKVFQNNDGQYFTRTEVAVDKAIAEQLHKDWEQSAKGTSFR
jgi:hypothetical protein